MQRRDFIKNSLAGLAVSAGVSTLASANSLLASPSPSSKFDWSLGFKSVEQDSLAPMEMDIHGSIPKSLQGLFLRNGPAKLTRGDLAYQHWFDGDGMIQQFTISDGKVAHKGQFVHTSKYLEEEAAQQFLYSGAGTTFKNAKNSRNNDSINAANTALLEWDNELLALWEGGSAYRLDAESLATKGMKTWRDDLKHMPFSAHPLIDVDGSMWNFGYAPYAGKNGKLVIYHIQPAATGSGVKNMTVIDLPFSGYMHDFAQTHKSLVFLLPPFTFTNKYGKSFVDKFEWRENLGSRLLVVDKQDMSKQRWLELPAGFVFHFGHASEHNNILQVNACWHKDAELMQAGMFELMQSGVTSNYDHAHAATIVANLHTNTVTLNKSSTSLEFPVFSESSFAPEAPIWGTSHRSERSLHSDKVVKWSPYAGIVDAYTYDDGVAVEEPIYIPAKSKGNTSKEDILVQSFLDVKNRRSGINIFEANALSKGPLASASMERLLPLGFHGTFIGA